MRRRIVLPLWLSGIVLVMASPGAAPQIEVFESPAAKTAPKKGPSNKKSAATESFSSQKKSGPGSSNRQVFDFIVLDAGHGGRDPGASGRYHTVEKHIALSITKKLYRMAKKAFPGKKIYLTRRSDRFVTLEGRSRYANRKFRDSPDGLFVSIHCNTAPSRRIYGFEVYSLSDSNKTEEARKLAAFENRHLIPPAPNKEVKKMESAMLMAQIKRESRRLANDVNRGMIRQLRRYTRTRGTKQANLHVLRESLMPAILVEVGFLTHKNEANHLRKGWYTSKVAKGILRGIERFLDRPVSEAYGS